MEQQDARQVDPPYVHGHHGAVLEAHASRTIADSARFAEHLFVEGTEVLDIGCGPGTITLEIACRVSPAIVVGIDAASEAVSSASAEADRRGVGNVRFEVADAYDLPFDDSRFDIVFAHQLLQHLARPVEALVEARRVLRPGGRLAVRDSDYGTMVHAPHEPAIDAWLALYQSVASVAAGDPRAGRMLPGWVAAAGFDRPVVTTSTWTYADRASVAAWSDLWVARLLDARLGEMAVASSLATRGQLEEMAAGWRTWAAEPNAFFAFLHGEVIATKP